MPKNSTFTGFAIALAWPGTYCKQPGSWYDGITNYFNISTNYFYKVGHAALVLVNTKTAKCYYFDFGRYHAPFQHGRVRGEITDPGLKINTLARLSKDRTRIVNFEQILSELQSNHECHGDGDLHAAYTPINFEEAYTKVRQMQERSPIPYGPFEPNGTNCSRFVCTGILSGKPPVKHAFKLKYMVFLTPTPLNNVNALQDKKVVQKPFYDPVLRPAPLTNKHLLKTTLPEPARPHSIPDNAQWLSGEGAGSWFLIKQTGNHYSITRFNDSGETECEGIFRKDKHASFDLNTPYRFVHLSHCNKVTIKQDEEQIEFFRVLEGKSEKKAERNSLPVEECL